MPDMEKVIKGLRICIDRVPGKYTCDKCPYETHGNECEIDLSEDALALLKEQPEIVRCKDCKHRPTQTEPYKTVGFSLEFPDYKCPCQCSDGYYSWYPEDDWFCANGERR